MAPESTTPQQDGKEHVDGSANAGRNEQNQVCHCHKAQQFVRKHVFARLPEWLAAIAAIVAVFVAYNALDIANNQLISGNRAWIAPGGIAFVRGSPDAENWIVGLKYQNTGNQPALEFNYIIETFPMRAGDLHNMPILRQAITTALKNKTCRGFNGKDDNSAIFPNTRYVLAIDVKADDKKRYVANTHFLVVAGYITYKTFGEIRRSCFCRFFDFTADSKNPKGWRSSVCRLPEYAD